MTIMLLRKWKRRESRHGKAGSEQLKQDMLAKHAELDMFVASLRVEIETSGETNDGPIAGT